MLGCFDCSVVPMLHAGGAGIPHLHNLALAPLNINEILSSNTAGIPHLHNLNIIGLN
jgi:hypothetical protein